jgi:hypothetical protein
LEAIPPKAKDQYIVSLQKRIIFIIIFSSLSPATPSVCGYDVPIALGRRPVVAPAPARRSDPAIPASTQSNPLSELESR